MNSQKLDTIEHVAISVDNIAKTVDWYTKTFKCKVSYQDDSWALLDFANIQLTFVLPSQHPPHIALSKENAKSFGKLSKHRDGTSSTYIYDPFGNAVEIMNID